MAEQNEKEKGFLSSLTQGHGLDALISAPLTAVSKANAMMLSGQAQFILDYCFREKDGVFKPVFIKMEYTTQDGLDEYFNLPLLCILPFNNLAVDKVDISFNVEITSTTTHVSNTADDSNLAKSQILEKKTKIGAKIGSQNDGKNGKSKSVNNISVKLKAKQIPITRGVSTLIDLYSKNIITSKD